MNPASNFACYRAMFKMAVESTGGRVSSILSLLCKERPMGYLNDESEQLFLIFFFFFQFEYSIPFFSLFVKDVYFLNEGHSNRFEISFFNVHNLYFLPTWFSSLSTVCVIIYHNWIVNGAFLSIFLRRLPNGHINFEVETSFVSISHLPTFHKAS